MKKFMFLFLIAFLAISINGWGQIISQYVETSSGTSPKGIEIWNNTGSTLDFSTNNLIIKKGTNGGAPATDYTLSSGTLASGDVIVIGTSDMQSITEANGSVFYLKAFTFNGDDALEVWYGSTKTDVFGEPGVDPGTGWSGNGVQTWNQNIQLLSGITTGDTDGWTDPSLRFETVCTDNCLTGFGLAPSSGGNQNPVIANISNSPTYPTSSDAVSVSADVTDSDGSVTSVELHWATVSGGPYTTISMSNTSGDTYESDTDIPAQADGATVYFEIYAEDNDGGSTTSPEQNYYVHDAATTTLPYNETFDTDLGECYPFSVSGDTKYWVWNSTDQAASMNGYNSGDLEEDWLIIPGIDFDNYSNEYMTFDTWYKYGTDDANNYLKLMYSSDYPGIGDPSGSTWTELSYTQPAAAETWTSSGTVDLSSISGTSVYIAFKYHYNSGSYRTWEVDNILIQEPTTDPQPSNYPTSFTATTNSATAITTSWTDAAGPNLPSGYLILANLTGTFTAPTDGTPVADDTDWGDGNGAMNVAYGVGTYQWTGLDPNTQYYFIIYPYSNSGSTIDYKTDGTPPTADATTNTAVVPNAWINEFHYDNIGTDVGEFVEIVIENPGDYTLSDFQLDLYNGNNGASYDTKTADLFTVGTTDGNYTFYYYDYPANGIQNGAPDGLALSYQGILITGQFLSYEGSFTATDGPANGETSIDIGVSESNSTTQIGESLQLKGGGDSYDLFTWQDPAAETKGSLNNKQYLGNYTTWTGNTDNDWATSTNWNNGVPDASQNVIVPQGLTNYPTLSASGNCDDIILESNTNRNASILGNSYLTVSGTTKVERYFQGYDDGALNG
ncbi:MAG TPA: DUF5017 domain-containing protein, partial [Bacteroidetes bacterium]|nr:DUF5017 domain-containing protein [Bacteroidota bacterium]